MIYITNQNTAIAIPEWTAEDYESPSPFEWLYERRSDKFLLAQLIEKVRKQAGAVGVRNFMALWKAYLSSKADQNKTLRAEESTQFSGQPLELISGEYMCDDTGISTTDKFGFPVSVCPHPIIPVKRLTNIDTGVVKVELAYRRGKKWKNIIVDKSTVASAQKIVELSNNGIEVNSESARDMVRYLSTLESMNYDNIPEIASVGRLGWIADRGFSPYEESVVFDGDQSYRGIFDAVKPVGDFDKWLDCVRKIRKESTIARMMIDASFASALIDPCNALPFFFHVWGSSGSGKTVCLMAAASVWANPTAGKYIQTFNSTTVGLEVRAGLCNSLPLCLDELQVIKDRKNFDNTIYMLSEGVGKTRGSKNGGTQHLYTWANCIITTGEMPISNDNSGGGAVNRIIEVDYGDEMLVKNPRDVVALIRSNYGHAGKKFAEALQDENAMDDVRKIYTMYSAQLDNGGSTEKQTMAAALILTADVIAEKLLFKSGKPLRAKDIEPFLTSKLQVDQNLRAYEWLFDFVGSNPMRFRTNDYGDYTGECWGVIDEDYIYFIKSVFDAKLQDAGYNSVTFLSWAKRRGKIECDDTRHSTKPKKIYGQLVRCVWLRKNIGEIESPKNANFV